jgi:hypothetical protein
MKAKKPKTNVAMTIQDQTKMVRIISFASLRRGTLEYWNIGILRDRTKDLFCLISYPLFHHSNLPFFHNIIIPTFHHSGY